MPLEIFTRTNTLSIQLVCLLGSVLVSGGGYLTVVGFRSNFTISILNGWIDRRTATSFARCLAAAAITHPPPAIYLDLSIHRGFTEESRY